MGKTTTQCNDQFRKYVRLLLQRPKSTSNLGWICVHTYSKHTERVYISVDQRQHYWDKAIPVSWLDVHLSNEWHLNPKRVLVTAISASICARLEEIRRRRAQHPVDLRRHDPTFGEDLLHWDTWFYNEHDDLHHDPAFAEDSPHWDTWFYNEHDGQRRSFFGTPTPRALERPQRTRAPAHKPPCGSAVKEDEAFKKAHEDSQLDKFAEWHVPPLALAESAAAAVVPPSLSVPEAEQQESWPLSPLVGVDDHDALHA